MNQSPDSGQAALEMALLLPVLLLLLGGVMTLGPLVYAHLAVLTAANDCAVAAAQTLSGEQGRFQGVAAAQATLASYHVRQDAGILVASTWERGAPVTCTVSYTVDLSGIPLVASFNPDPHVEYSVTLPAQAYKSVWR